LSTDHDFAIALHCQSRDSTIKSISGSERRISGSITIETDNSICYYSAISGKASTDDDFAITLYCQSRENTIKSTSDVERRIYGSTSI
jgi:hypothetical protein